jgi:uncharacterized protein
MDIKTLKDNGNIIFESICGSYAYGTFIEGVSDKDIKGIFKPSISDLISLNEPVLQVNDESNDTVYYSLKRFFELGSKANPNIIEMLWYPNDCILICTETMLILKENRKLFISKEAYRSHAEYARAQIKKAKGKNKKVHNPSPKERPVKEDFCRVIPLNRLSEGSVFSHVAKENRTLNATEDYERFPVTIWDKRLDELGFPFRPIPIKELGIDLKQYHVASLEHVPNAYRLYFYGNESKGVFRGNDMLVCESIPKEHEWEKIFGLLIYDKNEYEKAVNDWHSYWGFMKNRNESRWSSQIDGTIDYDVKNMQHCFRLLYSGLNILTEGEPIVRCDGELLQFLKDIRNEKFTYDELMVRLSVLEDQMETAFKKSSLLDKSDFQKLDKLYRHIIK